MSITTKKTNNLILKDVIVQLFNKEEESKWKEELIQMAEEGKVSSHVEEICKDEAVPDHSKKKFLYTYLADAGIVSNGGNAAWNPMAKLREGLKQKSRDGLKKVTHACVQCQKNHTSCDNKRPCKRCTTKGMADQCVVAEGKIRGRKKTKLEVRGDLSPEALNRTLEKSYCAGDASNIMDWPPTLRTFSASEGAQMADRVAETVKLDPEQMNELFTKIQACEKRTRENRAKVTPEQKDKMCKEFYFQLESCSVNAAQVEIPAFVWGLYGVIWYVNQPFRNLTNWKGTIPSKLVNFEFTDLLGGEALYDFYCKVLTDILDDQGLTHRFWPGTLKVSPSEGVETDDSTASNRKGGEIEGTFCVTVKRDIFGLPCIFYGHFLPSASELGVLGQ
eukprot:TRINITY_DN7020_c0_g1_i1.p1 TRINITY_DN7020_c0_g1~~TRINITY_DN7020_c0_g1_i1.p1  ORF type:complete len:390 (-),score=115.93 TRINITY_DN7020_c0_g1_i1:34-1203(-)